jgi:hypothetical protein
MAIIVSPATTFIPVTDFYDYIIIDIPGIALTLAEQEIMNAAIDFFVDSKVWTEELVPIDIVSGTHSYGIAPADPSGSRVVDIMSAFIVGSTGELDPATKAFLDAQFQDWKTTGTGVPKYYFSDVDRQTIRLVKTPSDSQTGGLEVLVSLAPKRTATSIPDFILERWIDAITHRAKWRLFQMRKKPWSDPNLALFHNMQYESMVGIADTESSQGFARQRMRSTAYYK